MIKEIASLPDVSFIENKTLDDVQAEMVADYQRKYKEVTGKDLELRRADEATLQLYAASVQIYNMLLHTDRSGKMDLLKYAFGEFLDNIGAGKGVSRLPAFPAMTTVRFTLSAEQSSSITIPAGIRVSNGSEIYFATDEVKEIPAGSTYADISCTCQTPGAEGNGIMAGAINTLVDPLPYIGSVANTEATNGGSDIESDEDFRERIYLAPSAYSVAGPITSYEYYVRSCASNIGDVEVSSPNPAEVAICFLLKDGSIPGSALVEMVENYLLDKNIRPVADRVEVSAPDTSTFDVSLTYYINRSDQEKALTIQSEVNKAVNDYILWQTSKIGRDINPDVLRQKVMDAGAKRVTVSYPAYTVVNSGYVGKLGTKSVTYGGLEDD